MYKLFFEFRLISTHGSNSRARSVCIYYMCSFLRCWTLNGVEISYKVQNKTRRIYTKITTTTANTTIKNERINTICGPCVCALSRTIWFNRIKSVLFSSLSS